MRKTRVQKSCYGCKKHFDKNGHPCPNVFKEGFNPCEKFEWNSTYKSFNKLRTKKK